MDNSFGEKVTNLDPSLRLKPDYKFQKMDVSPVGRADMPDFSGSKEPTVEDLNWEMEQNSISDASGKVPIYEEKTDPKDDIYTIEVTNTDQHYSESEDDPVEELE